MRRRRWHPTKNVLNGLLFSGAPALLSKLDSLVLRPRIWWRETLLPIIYIDCGSTGKKPLDGIADRLHQTRGILYSRINGRETPPAENGQPAERSIHQLLDGVVADLSYRGGRGRPLKFPHYSLTVWLAGLIISRTAPNKVDHEIEQRVDNAFQDFLKKRYQFINATTNTQVSAINEIPWWVRIPVLLLPPLGIRLMRIFWRPPQWVAGNRISSAHSASSFSGLARKFMEQGSGEHQHDIHQNEIDRLLVDAFMEDLRCGYRRTGPLFFGRRRTTYPVLLIDKKTITTATDLNLLKIISDSRTDYLRENSADPGRLPRKSAYFHPLLIIAQGDGPAFTETRRTGASDEESDDRTIGDIEFYYREWYDTLTERNRTWFIPLAVPSGLQPEGIRSKLTEIVLPTPQPPRATIAMAVLLPIVASFITYDRYYTHCGTWYWEPELQRQTLTTDRTQCVGLGASDYRFFDKVGEVIDMTDDLAANLKEVEETIHKNNELAVKSSRYLTVVYLTELTSRSVGDYRSELQRLRGIAIAQDRSMKDRPVRVLLANAGDGMDYGELAADAIVKEAREDDTLVAVVGLGISRIGTRDAIMRLADTSIPTIGAALSATELATSTSQYYHQVAPTNQRQADVAAFYARALLEVKNVTIYYSADQNDLWSNDLKDQTKRAFNAAGLAVREQPYRVNPGDDGGDVYLVGQGACDVGPDGLVFYAGRSEQLPVFLEGMKNACPERYPKLLGGDDIEQFTLNGGLQNFPELTVDYLSQASSLAWTTECNSSNNNVDFLADYQRLFNEGACANTWDGGALITHDALLVFIEAVRRIGIDRPSGDAVLAGIKDISSAGPGPLVGASGVIDYPRTGYQAIPTDKATLVLRARADTEPERMLLCGKHETAQPPPDECPALPGP